MNSTITIISARWVVPVEPHNSVLDDHAVVIENGLIKELCSREQALANYPQANHLAHPEHVIIPGLINAHTHAAMTLFRGMADDTNLMEWLEQHIWPAEAQWVDHDFVRDGTELAVAEMLASGTTLFSDMYFYPDEVARTAQEMGIRAAVGMIVLDFPSVWASNADEYLEKGLEVHDEARSLSRISTTLAPHAPYTVSDDPLVKIRTYADELNVPIHMHVHETAHEVEQAVAATGKRPLQRLDDLGLLNPRMVAVHMTQVNQQEIALLARQGVSVVHCPNSNAKLASGSSPVGKLMRAGVNVCLGTDSAASNNNLDMFQEMRAAALYAKSLSGDASELPAWQVLQMATINGAKALNQQDEIGSLLPGKAADMVAVNLNHISTQPVYDPISQLVYSASSSLVSDVWVGGRQRLKDGEFTEIDLQALLVKAVEWSQKIKQTKPANAHTETEIETE